MCRLVILDDHALFRDALRALLPADLQVVGEAATAQEALGLIREHAPNVLVTDISLQGPNGITAAADTRRISATTYVLMLTMHTHEEYVVQSFAAGATGYACKDESPDAVFEAIRTVARGRRFLSARFSPA